MTDPHLSGCQGEDGTVKPGTTCTLAVAINSILVGQAAQGNAQPDPATLVPMGAGCWGEDGGWLPPLVTITIALALWAHSGMKPGVSFRDMLANQRRRWRYATRACSVH